MYLGDSGGMADVELWRAETTCLATEGMRKEWRPRYGVVTAWTGIGGGIMPF